MMQVGCRIDYQSVIRKLIAYVEDSLVSGMQSISVSVNFKVGFYDQHSLRGNEH
jgi:hypothetical protein